MEGECGRPVRGPTASALAGRVRGMALARTPHFALGPAAGSGGAGGTGGVERPFGASGFLGTAVGNGGGQGSPRSRWPGKRGQISSHSTHQVVFVSWIQKSMAQRISKMSRFPSLRVRLEVTL